MNLHDDLLHLLVRRLELPDQNRHDLLRVEPAVETSQSDISKPETSQSDRSQSDIRQLDISQSETNQSEM